MSNSKYANIDLKGQVFGSRKALEMVGDAGKYGNKWSWVCVSCGKTGITSTSALLGGKTGCVSCSKIADLSDKKIGLWTVIRLDKTEKGTTYWCLCECGTQRSVGAGNLVGGGSLSCGCTNGHMQPFGKRFWSKVDKKSRDECWEWTGNKDKDGYGIISVDGSSRRTHRISWAIANNSFYADKALPPVLPPSDVLICHKCDNPPCCNPEHLFAGTPKDNTHDCLSKGRFPDSLLFKEGNTFSPLGSANPNSKLNESQVAEIKQHLREGVLYKKDIAQKYGVTPRIITLISRNEIWRHVQ